jgi:hypothetical protein
MTNHVAGAARANEEERERAKGQTFSTEEDETLRKARTQPGWTWKAWSAQEDATIREARTQPGWTWKGIASRLPGRTEKMAYMRWRHLQQGQSEVAPPSSKHWSAQEDATLRKARGQPGWTWKGIKSQLPGRTQKAAFERWRHLQRGQSEVAPPSSKRWSAQEDATLRKARTQPVWPGWTWEGIASQLPGRSEKAAFERWRYLRVQQAAPRQRRHWSAQDDATIRKARAEPGWTWEGIASQLPGRSEWAAKERWKSLQRGQSLQTAGEEDRG